MERGREGEVNLKKKGETKERDEGTDRSQIQVGPGSVLAEIRLTIENLVII